MILPIVAYGDPVLKKMSEEIDEGYPELDELIDNMFETMYEANGVGLAAPQIGKNIRLFIIDLTPFEEEYPELKDYKKVFINPRLIEEEGKEWAFNEGCLSIPGIREDVVRKPKITVEYYDRNWDLLEEDFEGIPARVIQHEYDHIDGVLFTDHLSVLKKRLLKGKLKDISKGKVDVAYRMKFPELKK